MPYRDLPPLAFWASCRKDDHFLLPEIYAPKVKILPGERVATAGSCFAQNVVPFVRNSPFEYVDVEPPPAPMSAQVAQAFGYTLFSARYGNIYTPRQLRQLLEDVIAESVHDCAIWRRDDRFVDALRPRVEPDGLSSVDEVRDHRIDHLRRVRQMFETADVFFFTLGLTETWQHHQSGVVFPSAPGVLAGSFDPNSYSFANLGLADCLEDTRAALHDMRQINPDLKVILTVSPVPLTATATGGHVLSATTYSKSVLRAVAGEIAAQDPATDYFPAYEIITGTPFGSQFYQPNLRSVTEDGITTVMSVFFAAHGHPNAARAAPRPVAQGETSQDEDAEICEEALLEVFASS